MKVKLIQPTDSELIVLWEDGHESSYPLEPLRRSCPCAHCEGEIDFFGRVSKGAATNYTAASFQLLGVDPIGNYGLQPNWADGHSWGIWTATNLRARCCCPQCAGHEGTVP